MHIKRSVCIQTIDDRMYERWYKKHLNRLKAIRERENRIPGPTEAKRIMKLIELERLQARERRLEVNVIRFASTFYADIITSVKIISTQN